MVCSCVWYGRGIIIGCNIYFGTGLGRNYTIFLYDGCVWLFSWLLCYCKNITAFILQAESDLHLFILRNPFWILVIQDRRFFLSSFKDHWRFVSDVPRSECASAFCFRCVGCPFLADYHYIHRPYLALYL